MRFLVVSNIKSKRTDFFIKAGEALGLNPCFITYNNLIAQLPNIENTVIKLEPEQHSTALFSQGCVITKEYIEKLQLINSITINNSVKFINNPIAIINSLDKYTAKNKIAHLPCTPIYKELINNYDNFIDFMKTEQCSSYFIKPRYGSGAGGVVALRYNKKNSRIIAFSSLLNINELVFNGKQISQYNENTIRPILSRVLENGAVIEKWIPKSTVNSQSYDLRVVCSFGKVDHSVVRFSSGVITNLHLNNMAETLDKAKLPQELIQNINKICLEATAACELNYAGIDVLINNDKPYIIEINGQGDHIYQDIFQDNNIYKNQIKNYMH